MRFTIQCRTRRSAMTLIEVMVAVVVTTILAGVAMSLLIGLRDWDRDMRQRVVHNEQLLRLGEALRADIRQGVEVSLPTSDVIVVRAANEKQSRYELSRDGCRRIATSPSDSTPRIETFTVGPSTSWTLAPGPPGRLPMFAVTLDRASFDHEKSQAALVVHAAAGADASVAGTLRVP